MVATDVARVECVEIVDWSREGGEESHLMSSCVVTFEAAEVGEKCCAAVAVEEN